MNDLGMTQNLLENWQFVGLGDICKTTSGGTPSRRNLEYYDGNIPWVKSGELPDGPVVEIEECISEKAVSDSSAKVFPAGTLLVAMYGATVGKLGILKCDAATNQAVCAIFPPEEVQTKFLFWFLRSVREELISQAIGGAQPNISQGILREIKVPLAPLKEQTRIVAEIEKQFSRLDEAVANLKRVKANLKRYKAAVLKAAVEGKLTEEWRHQHPDIEPADKLLERILAPPRPNRYDTRSKDLIFGHPALAVGNPKTILPKGWIWSRLVGVARMESGHTPSRSHPEWWDGEVPWIGIADARENHGRAINGTFQHTNAAGLANSSSRLLPVGTVCVSRTASVGYVVVMGKEMATSQDFVNWIPTEAVTSDWLRVIFMADPEALRRFGKGSVHKTIYFPEWLSAHIAVPPLAEQHQVVAEVERRLSIVAGTEAQVDANLRRADRLRQSILKQAFSGQLVPQDPNDEPASVLLERIRKGVGAIHESPARAPHKPKRAIHESPLRKPRPQTAPAPAVSEKFACLDDVTAAILGLMRPGREYTRAEIADTLGLSTGRWNAAIQDLKRQRKVRQLGEKRGARYVRR